MTDLHAVETEPPDWDGPVIELVEEGRLVGRVYADEGRPVAEFLHDDDGEPWLFEVEDLQRVLDVAMAMLGVEEPPTAIGARHPVDLIAAEFDGEAAHRADEDEGFYPSEVVKKIAARSESLDLAVATLEAFHLVDGEVESLQARPTDLAAAHAGEAWATLRAGCNVQAMAMLERWADQPGVVLAVELVDRQGERFVL